MEPWDFEPAVWADPNVVLGSGPDTVLCDPPAPMPRARHVGFTADLTDAHDEPEPQPFRFQPPV